jgi:hypothetical protein
VLLEALVADAGPAYPASLLNTKNVLLRVTVTVRGAGRRDVTFAVGELDPAFGNHPALLALTQNGRPIAWGPELVVPGDRVPIRFVPGVSVSFAGPGGVQAHTEVGPSLLEVLAAAGVAPTLDTWVAAVGDDNYVATVTPAEQFAGQRPLQSLSEDGATLAQPRLVTDGDVKGGRYVSDVVDIYAGTGPAS